jgi:hypothetical protein
LPCDFVVVAGWTRAVRAVLLCFDFCGRWSDRSDQFGVQPSKLKWWVCANFIVYVVNSIIMMFRGGLIDTLANAYTVRVEGDRSDNIEQAIGAMARW